MHVTGTISSEQLAYIETSIAQVPKKVDFVVVASINESLVTVRSPMLSLIKEKFGIRTVTAIRNATPIYKATAARPEGAIRFKGGTRGMNLAAFRSTHQTSAGIESDFGDVKSAFFIQTMRPSKTGFTFEGAVKGNTLVVSRWGPKRPAKSGRYAGRTFRRGPHKGQPILRQAMLGEYGPTPAELAIKTPEALRIAEEQLPTLLQQKIEQKIKFVQEKAGVGNA